MSKVLPILFNTDMVRAIMDGRKTATRRKIDWDIVNFCDMEKDGTLLCYEDCYGDHIPPEKLCRYQPNDILWVRETWRVGAWDLYNQRIAFDYKDGGFGPLVDIQDKNMFDRLVEQSREDARNAGCKRNCHDFVWKKGQSPCRWRSSIHMPKEAARIFLRVIDVRVERLQEMTASESAKEGIVLDSQYDTNERAYILAFADLWDSTIKKSDLDTYGWEANPYVFVIEFERCEKPKEF